VKVTNFLLFYNILNNIYLVYNFVTTSNFIKNKPASVSFGLIIDTDAINELYTYGGEGGKKKS